MLDTPGEVVFLGDFDFVGEPPSAAEIAENQSKLKHAAYLMDQWRHALPKLKPGEIWDAYVAAAYEDLSLHLSKKHPLGVFCEGGLLPPRLKRMILECYEEYDFAQFRLDNDQRYDLPEPCPTPNS